MALADDLGLCCNILCHVVPIDRPFRTEIDNEIYAIERWPFVRVLAVNRRKRKVVVLKSLTNKARISITRIG